jgi:hypothetical protein
MYSKMSLSKWVKLIDLTKEISFEEFSLHGNFVHVADVISTPPDARRMSVITFQPVIPQKVWNEKTTQWIYIFTIDGKIVKIGGTRTGLANRAASYLCGHHTEDRGKSGKCSVTNAYLYNTLDHCIRTGLSVKMYGYRIPPVKVSVDIWGTSADVEAQVYNAFESRAISAYFHETGHNPQLSDNSDPAHR